MSSGAASAGFRRPSQPGGFSAALERSTICVRALLRDRLTEYGSVTRLFSTRPVLRVNTLSSYWYYFTYQLASPMICHTPEAVSGVMGRSCSVVEVLES